MEMTQPSQVRRSVNPLLPSNEFIPDGEPRVFGARVYLYGSHDLAVGGMCAGDYVTWSAPLDDIADWRFEGVIYRADQDPYIAARRAAGKNGFADRLFAPDVLDIDGRYYLYYGVGLSATGFGVAVSDAPTGPFEYVGRVRYPDSAKPAGWKDTADGIDDGDFAFGGGRSPLRRLGFGLGGYPYDPAILQHDGRLFLYFGLLNCSVIELDPADKRTLIRNPETRRWVTPILRASPIDALSAMRSGRRRETVMLNGPSIREIDGSFVLSYWAMGGQGFSGMYHAVADSPVGPFKPAGPLVALGNAWKDGQVGATDRVGNTHGGMFRVGDTWYQIYHRQTANGRQACGTALTRRSDAGFEQADYASVGLDPRPLDAFGRWPANIACHLTGRSGRIRQTGRPSLVLREHPEGTEDHDSGRSTLQVVSGTRAGAVAGYKYLDFGPAPGASIVFDIEIDPRSSGTLDVLLDNPAGSAVATVTIPTDMMGKGWAHVSAPAPGISGVHALFLRFNPARGELGDVASFGFTRVPAQAA
jgi:hypothetical protein